MKIQEINLQDYTYLLPEDKIAASPELNRDQSKLQVYEKGEIKHQVFTDIVDHLKEGDTLFFNDTKVIPARLHFKKDTGANIEIFLLNPAPPVDLQSAMAAKKECVWNCLVGNLKKMKSEVPLEALLQIKGQSILLRAFLVDREQKIIRFEWCLREPQTPSSDITFSEILIAIGQIPLPPYIKREVRELDKTQYQTVYAQQEGAVAAPTAGLHFSESVLHQLKKKGIHQEYVTLHVSGGTFSPIKVDHILDHAMHQEEITISNKTIDAILKSKNRIAVGTTSLRTLESLYWFGVKLQSDANAPFFIEKLYPYEVSKKGNIPDLNTAMNNIKAYLKKHQVNTLTGVTEIMILPGYDFKTCNGLITNFHMPGTTLILLVAAFIGSDWKKVYVEALNNNYRFLSFGDSSLLWRNT